MGEKSYQKKDTLLTTASSQYFGRANKEFTLLAPFDVDFATRWLDRLVAYVHYHHAQVRSISGSTFSKVADWF